MKGVLTMEKEEEIREEAAVQEETQETAKSLEEAGEGTDSYKIQFKKPYEFEGEAYLEVDLSGLEDMSGRDMSLISRSMEREGNFTPVKEVSVEYAFRVAAKATKLPVEFFEGLPMKEAAKVKNKVLNFFYGED